MTYAPPLDATALPPPLPRWLQEAPRPAPPLTEACPPPPVALLRAVPAARRGAGRRVLGLHPPAGAAGAGIRLGHLRRRRQHPGAHARDGGAHRRARPASCRPPISPASARPARRWTRWRAATGTPASATSSRCAATCPAAAGMQPHPGGYAYAADLVAGLKRVADFEISVAAYPETHPDGAERRRRPRQPQAQARCRRDPRHHPVFLRGGDVICASSTARWPPASPRRSCRASCRSPISPRR